MKYQIIIDIESDTPLNLLAQKLKNNAEESVIEILSNTKANTFVNTKILERIKSSTQNRERAV